MKRVRGLPNDRYRERKEAFERIIAKVAEGTATDPIPDDFTALLDRMP